MAMTYDKSLTTLISCFPERPPYVNCKVSNHHISPGIARNPGIAHFVIRVQHVRLYQYLKIKIFERRSGNKKGNFTLNF